MNSKVFAIIGILSLIFITQLHEEIHVMIFDHYGIDSEIHWFKEFPDVVTTPESNCPREACILAHNINDIIGWPLTFLFALWVFLRFSDLATKEFDEYKKELIK